LKIYTGPTPNIRNKANVAGKSRTYTDSSCMHMSSTGIITASNILSDKIPVTKKTLVFYIEPVQHIPHTVILYLTPLSRIPLEKLVKKFPTFHGTQMFITVFTRSNSIWPVHML
jgi:hypothetical protein